MLRFRVRFERYSKSRMNFRAWVLSKRENSLGGALINDFSRFDSTQSAGVESSSCDSPHG
jgi:hypothetical protein